MIRIVIADDHEIVRAGLKQIISDDDDMVVLGESNNGENLIELVKKNDYDIVLLDLKMSGISGIDVIKHLKVIKPNLPILVLSMHAEDQYAVRTIKAGASGYLTKETAAENLIIAVRIEINAGNMGLIIFLISQMISRSLPVLLTTIKIFTDTGEGVWTVI